MREGVERQGDCSAGTSSGRGQRAAPLRVGDRGASKAVDVGWAAALQPGNKPGNKTWLFSRKATITGLRDQTSIPVGAPPHRFHRRGNVLAKRPIGAGAPSEPLTAASADSKRRRAHCASVDPGRQSPTRSEALASTGGSPGWPVSVSRRSMIFCLVCMRLMMRASSLSEKNIG